MRDLLVDDASQVYLDTEVATGGSPTLLLVHGFPLSHRMWCGQVDGLSEVCRVVAPDLRGYGESCRGEWPKADEPPTLARYADDLAALIDHLQSEGPVVLAGFSMGGYIALEMQRRHADRFDALVLIDTKAAADTEEARATRLKMADKIGEWGAARVAELMRPNLFAPETPERIANETVRDIASTRPEAIAVSQRAMAARPDSTPLLSRIDEPTLVVCGEHDAISPPAEMRGIAHAIPDAQFVEIEGASHMAPVEKPDAVNAALREFLVGL